MEQVKSGSSKWLNEKKHIAGKFAWQNGYGAFTYSKSHIDRVVKYILNQPEHHKKESFRDEYLLLLEKFDIDYARSTYLSGMNRKDARATALVRSLGYVLTKKSGLRPY